MGALLGIATLAVLLLILSVLPLIPARPGFALLLLVAVPAVLANAAYALRQHRRLPRLAAVYGGCWQLQDHTGPNGCFAGDWRFAGEVLLWPWLVIVPLKRADGQRCTLVWWPDSAPAEDQRRLRVWLNTAAGRERIH
nr:protein YgfX [Marinimicrobium alkaliphilum]